MSRIKRRTIKILYKLRAIRMYKHCKSFKKVSKVLKIDRAMVRRWVRKEDSLKFIRNKQLRSNASNV